MNGFVGKMLASICTIPVSCSELLPLLAVSDWSRATMLPVTTLGVPPAP